MECDLLVYSQRDYFIPNIYQGMARSIRLVPFLPASLIVLFVWIISWQQESKHDNLPLVGSPTWKKTQIISIFNFWLIWIRGRVGRSQAWVTQTVVKGNYSKLGKNWLPMNFYSVLSISSKSLKIRNTRQHILHWI